MPTSASCSPGHRPLPLQARRCRCTRRCGELAGLRSPGYLRAHHGPFGDRRQRRSAAVRGQRHGRRHAWAGAHSPARPSKPSPWRAIRRVASTLPSTAAGTRTAYERDREPELRTEQSPWEGPLAAQLVHSRDGLNWHRFSDRTPIIPRGARGSFDAGCILCSADRPLVHGDEVWHYYTGINTMHGCPMPPKRCVIGRVSWRLDGFVSLDAAAFEGWVETVPLAPAGRRLLTRSSRRPSSDFGCS